LDHDLDCRQNLVDCSLGHSSKTVHQDPFKTCLSTITIYLSQAARPISQHNIHMEGKKREEKNELANRETDEQSDRRTDADRHRRSSVKNKNEQLRFIVKLTIS